MIFFIQCFYPLFLPGAFIRAESCQASPENGMIIHLDGFVKTEKC